MDDNVDTKQIVTSSPSVYWKRPPRQPQMTWMKMVQNNLDSHRLSWTDTVDLAQNRPLWMLLVSIGDALVVQAGDDEMMMMIFDSSFNQTANLSNISVIFYVFR